MTVHQLSRADARRVAVRAQLLDTANTAHAGQMTTSSLIQPAQVAKCSCPTSSQPLFILQRSPLARLVVHCGECTVWAIAVRQGFPRAQRWQSSVSVLVLPAIPGSGAFVAASLAERWLMVSIQGSRVERELALCGASVAVTTSPVRVGFDVGTPGVGPDGLAPGALLWEGAPTW